jgi:predicted nucleic acid-binding protein
VTVLLEANILIALTLQEHEHHERATIWIASIDRFAVSPVVQGALARFWIRLGEPPAAVTEIIRRIEQLPACEFWPDSISYADADLRQVRGHRQVTDAYLVSLARSRKSAVGTLDEGLASSFPNDVHLVPHLGGIGALGGSDPSASAPPRHRPHA